MKTKSIEEIPQFNWSEVSCNHPDHDVPGMVVLKPGTNIHICPGCKQTQSVVVTASKLKEDKILIY